MTVRIQVEEDILLPFGNKEYYLIKEGDFVDLKKEEDLFLVKVNGLQLVVKASVVELLF